MYIVRKVHIYFTGLIIWILYSHMTEYRIDYSIDDYPCHYMAAGILAESSNLHLALKDDDLTKNCAWHEDGFGLAHGLSDDILDQLKSTVTFLIDEAILGICNRKGTVQLERYHHFVDDNEHFAVTKQLRNVPYVASNFFPLDTLDDLISNTLKIPVTSYNPNLQRHGCSIRIIRPKSKDYNPLHRDGWLDRLRHAVNAYIPIAGSNPLSSLSLIPSSHRWNESETERTIDGCIVNGKTFTVPSVVSSIHPLKMTRPPVKNNEMLIFSPYLIHGGAYNFNEDITRISLEMRFWKKM